MKSWIRNKRGKYFALTLQTLLVPVLLSIGCTNVFGKDDASALAWRWQYDDEDRLTELVGPGNSSAQISYEISKRDSLTSTINFGDEKRIYDWSAEGQLLSAKATKSNLLLSLMGAKTAKNTVSFRYNKQGLPTEVLTDGAPTLRYEYDVEDRLIASHIGKTIIGYRYDYLNRLAVIDTPVGEINYVYNRAENEVIRRLPNGLTTVRKFDDEGRLIVLLHNDSDNRPIAYYEYKYRPDGLIEGIREENRRKKKTLCRYDYDLMQRLISVECDGAGRIYEYSYDALGNLTSSKTASQSLAFTNTKAGVLKGDNRGATDIDKRGHLRKRPSLPRAIDYDFSNAGELKAAMQQSLRFTYNALGLLTSRKSGMKQTNYLPNPFADAWQPLWRRDAKGKESVIVWDGGVPLMELQGSSVQYRLEDHLGSIRIEADNKGAITVWHNYSPYGVPDSQPTTSDLMPGYAGLFWDPVAQVYLAKARAYAPDLGRFLQPDPQLRVPNALKHSHSLYAYCGGDPVNYVDRNGAEANPFGTVSFNAKIRWVDSFVRAYAYHSSGWLRSGIQKMIPNANAPLVLNTEPDARPTAVQFILNSAAQRATSTSALDQNLKDWRFGNPANPIPKEVAKYSFTEAEWQAAENATTAQLMVEGNPLGREAGVLWTGTLAGGWSVVKRGAQALGFRPSHIGMNVSSMGDYFVPTALETHKWQVRGMKQGWDGGDSLLQKIDDFIESPAYGAEIVENRIDTSPVFAPKNGILMSTTGPGKRGGRGGGITRPPSWKPPGSQGRPPPPPQPPLGGGPPSRNQALSMRVAPSPVGGVHLGGAGKLLEGFGMLKGVAIDEATGKLILVGEDDQEIGLPPLRLDDIVTIFRTVFDHGTAPSVTIDPDKENPMGPTMDIRHGPETQGTYVGWVLFECDRVMKTFQLGKDNVTQVEFVSPIEGHKETLDKVFFSDINDKNRESSWERFWIVPAAVNRFDLNDKDLSLFQLPLKVNTQKMKWKDGKLVDDKQGKSSDGAKAFKGWFSDKYDKIADEVLLKPPNGSGIEKPVAIFHELRRIAVIAAVAERLRDQGQSLPVWMRNYTVKPFHFADKTPSLSILKSNEKGQGASIYGGVDLSPADKDVFVFEKAEEAAVIQVISSKSDAADEETYKKSIKFVELSTREASLLSAKIPGLVISAEATRKIEVIKLEDDKKLNALVLPGVQSRALAPNRQQVTDMVVPIGLGRTISLTRYYNSFFDPNGEIGNGWTFNHPRLLMDKVPESRDGFNSTYRNVPHLVGPLGTPDIRFDAIENVEPYGIEMPVAKSDPEITGVVYDLNLVAINDIRRAIEANKFGSSQFAKTRIEKAIAGSIEKLSMKEKSKLSKSKLELLEQGLEFIRQSLTHQILFRNGSEWHFDKKGNLTFEISDGTTIRYIRDSLGRVVQIAGYVGVDVLADVKIEYDKRGRMKTAKAAQMEFLKRLAPLETSKVELSYTDENRLAKVVYSPKEDEGEKYESWNYSYDGSLLTRIGTTDGADSTFGYNDRGQLLWEKRGGRKIDHKVVATSKGTILTNTIQDAGSTRWSFDKRMRIDAAEFSNGVKLSRKYDKGKAITETYSLEGKPVKTRSISRDGLTETTEFTNGHTYELHRNAFGQPTTILIDGVLVEEVKWQPDGGIASLRQGNTQLQPLYHKEGWPNGLLISAPKDDSGKPRNWFQVERDILGRPIKTTDSSGYEYLIDYDKQGRLVTAGQATREGLKGSKVSYNEAGQITAIDSSWAQEKRNYSDYGRLLRIEIERDRLKSSAEFDDNGRPETYIAFDGGNTRWYYESEKIDALLRKLELPNGERIDYKYNSTDKKQGTEISMQDLVVRTQTDERGRITDLVWQ